MTSVALATHAGIFTIDGRRPTDAAPSSDASAEIPFADALVAASVQRESAAPAPARGSTEPAAGIAQSGGGDPVVAAVAGSPALPRQEADGVSGENSHAQPSPAEPEWGVTFELMVEQAGISLSAQRLPAAQSLRGIELEGERSLGGEGVTADVPDSRPGALSSRAALNLPSEGALTTVKSEALPYRPGQAPSTLVAVAPDASPALLDRPQKSGPDSAAHRLDSAADAEGPLAVVLASRLRAGEPAVFAEALDAERAGIASEHLQASTSVSPNDDSFMNPSSQARPETMLESLSRSSPQGAGKPLAEPSFIPGRDDHAELSQRMADAVGARLSAQIARGVWTMQLQLQPAQLGSIDVRLVMDQGRLRAQLKTGETLTRDLILEGLPRLRESLEQAGLNVSDVQVDLEYEGDRGKNTTAQDFGEIGKEVSFGPAKSDIVTADRRSPDDLSMLDLFI